MNKLLTGMHEMLCSGAEARWQNQGPWRILGRQIQEALATQADEPLEILVLETVPFRMNHMGCHMADAAFALHTMLRRLAGSSSEGA